MSLDIEWRCLQAARPESQTPKARHQRHARHRQRQLDPTRNWRAEEYALTKFKRATQETP